jgi:single-strand DNA-binding protein
VVTGRLKQRSWENQDGERRTVVEIEADDLGPSLKWATASVQKTSRSSSSSASAGGGDWGAAIAAPVGGPSTEEETPLDAG